MILRLLLCLATLPASSAGSRSVFWYLGDYTNAYVAENERFIAAHTQVVNGILHCCGGPSVLSNGTLSVSAKTRSLYANLTGQEVARKLGPVMLPLSPDPWAVQSGSAIKAVPALVELIVELGVSGLIADYEPHANETAAHAQAFVKFLAALSSGLHAKSKQLGVCVSDWGVIAPTYYKQLATTKADVFASMGSTYYGTDKTDPSRGLLNKLHVREMVAAFPLESIAIGIGTMSVAGACASAKGLLTSDYGWTQQSLTEYLDFLSTEGITKLGIWRADIAALLYKQDHYCGWVWLRPLQSCC